jgi:hypothetical protein
MNAHKLASLAALAMVSLSGSATATQVFRIDPEGQLTEVDIRWTLNGTCVTTELPAGERYVLIVENVGQDQPGFIKELFDASSSGWTHIHVNANQEGVILSSLGEFQRTVQEGGEERASLPGINAALASKGGSLSVILEGSPDLPFTVSLHGTRERDRMDFNRDDAVDGADLALGLEAASMPQSEVKVSRSTTNPCCVVAEMSLSPTMAEAQRSDPSLRYATPIRVDNELDPRTLPCEIAVQNLIEGWEKYAGQ